MIVAFDPGVGQSQPGGWCMMEEGEVILAEGLPVDGKMVAIPHILATIRDADPGLFMFLDDAEPPLIVVERQHARPQDSHSSMNIALPAYGQIIGMAQALAYPLVVVDPKVWKAVVLKGTARDKVASCAHVSQRYPSVNLHPGRVRVARDGIADAVCIAEWADRTNP